MKKFLIRLLNIFLPKPWLFSLKRMVEHWGKLNYIAEYEKNLILSSYLSLGNNMTDRDKLKLHEGKIFAQFGEDGLILYIFSKIGVKNHFFVEFGISNGMGSNAANLILNLKWTGLFIDSNENCVKEAKRYFYDVHDIKKADLNIIRKLITTNNINRLLVQNHVNEEIDFLSIDIDGNDYWIWKAITATKPRVVVIEYNASFGQKSISTVYDNYFDIYKKHPSGLYHGASLAALTNLAHSKGYILVGCESHGANAFFVRKDLAKGKIKEQTPRQAYYPLSMRTKMGSPQQQFEMIKEMKFITV